MAMFRLTRKAREDLKSIARYMQKTWGVAQRNKYLTQLDSNKERITIRLDPNIIERFRWRVRGGVNYQTLINEALREHMERQSGADVESTLRWLLHEDDHG